MYLMTLILHVAHDFPKLPLQEKKLIKELINCSLSCFEKNYFVKQKRILFHVLPSLQSILQGYDLAQPSFHNVAPHWPCFLLHGERQVHHRSGVQQLVVTSTDAGRINTCAQVNINALERKWCVMASLTVKMGKMKLTAAAVVRNLHSHTFTVCLFSNST